MSEKLEKQLKVLIIIASMGIWEWIVLNLNPLFGTITNYTSPNIGLLSFFMALFSGWLVLYTLLKE